MILSQLFQTMLQNGQDCSIVLPAIFTHFFAVVYLLLIKFICFYHISAFKNIFIRIVFFVVLTAYFRNFPYRSSMQYRLQTLREIYVKILSVRYDFIYPTRSVWSAKVLFRFIRRDFRHHSEVAHIAKAFKIPYADVNDN